MPSIKEVSHKENVKPRVLLSKENKWTGDTGETSFRIYYGATGAAVPFMWESRPGTPKHPMFSKSGDEIDDNIPPLTPPPSYATTSNVTIGHVASRRRKSRIFDVIFSSLSRKNSNVSPTSSSSSPLSWSTTSSSSSSSISSPRRLSGRKKYDPSHRRSISFCSFGAKSPLFSEEEHENNNNNDNNMELSSIMCFGFKKKHQGVTQCRT